MALAANAIITLSELQDYTNISQVLSDAFEIYNNSGSNTTATVAVSDSTLTLVGSGTGTDTFTLANASYDTMSELTAAITALSEGWQVLLLSASTASSDALVPFPATSVYGQSNTLRLQYNNTAFLEELINRASDMIEQFCNSIIVAQSNLRQTVEAPVRRIIRLDNWPVTAVSRFACGSEVAFTVQATDTTDLRATVEVQDDQICLRRINSSGTGVDVTRTFANSATASAMVTYIASQTGWTATLSNDCPTVDLWRMAAKGALDGAVDICFPPTEVAADYVDENGGMIYLTYPLNERGQVIVSSGYSTVPDPIKQACILLVQALYNERGRDGAMQSENIGSYSYSRSSGSDEMGLFTPTIRSLLMPYRRPLL